MAAGMGMRAGSPLRDAANNDNTLSVPFQDCGSSRSCGTISGHAMDPPVSTIGFHFSLPPRIGLVCGKLQVCGTESVFGAV
jgi:hypothetical protein